MDGTEDKILWEETEDVPTTPVDDEDEDGEVYADHLTSEEWQNLFGDSDDEDLAGFEWAETLLPLQMAPLGATKLTKVNDHQLIYCLFIYSLHLFPALPFSLRAHKLRKARVVILVSSTPQIRSFVTKLSKMAVFSSSDPSKFSGVPLVLSKSPFKLNIQINVSFKNAIRFTPEYHKILL